MPTLFTRILDGDLPARFVWKDDECGAFLSINPLQPGHTLVVPRSEVDHWIDLAPEQMSHLVRVSQTIGRALMAAFQPAKVGMTLVGLEVPHVHIHLVPIRGIFDMDFTKAERNPREEDLESAAGKIRAALRESGAAQVSD
jgi:histidine triad (HIT) family protein